MTDPSAARITVERFGDRWVILDASGLITTPRPLTEEAARAYCRLLRLPFPETSR